MPPPDRPGATGPGLDDLLAAVAAGRTELFGLVVREYALPVRAYLAGQMYHRADVDDLAQEVFLAALEDLSAYRRGEDFWAWLRGIARHKLLNHYRSEARRGQAVERFRQAVAARVADEYDRLAAADRAELVERLLACITRLPDRLRAVVRAGLDGRRAADLAAALNTTVGAVYALHYRANQLLRACVEGRAGGA